ncbi:DsrE family protein [Methanoregula sp.]|uniref:DsrE family protein n=1 Tax=Methanoregula sp. TaxID=2052170 RepID=UPI0023693411|nr:DsrE family protein [Methanoregula sp.]MDD1687837.1 DsrE family protein [Methanoregula sp.]
MVKTVKALGIRAPNAGILVGNILRNLEVPGEEVRFIVSPGAEAGMDAVARKSGYSVEVTPLGKDLEIRMTPSGKTLEEIDVTGETCPGPVILVGERLSSLAAGERLKVKSTSPDTLADITAAITAAGSLVLGQGTEGDRHFITIEKAEKKEKTGEPGVPVNRDRVLVVQSNGTGNAERAYATFIFAKVAVSMGKKVTVFLLMDGVSIARKGSAAGVKHPAFARLDLLMDEMVKAGVTIYACENSAAFRGITEKDLAPGVKLAGAATYIQLLSDPSYAVVNF